MEGLKDILGKLASLSGGGDSDSQMSHAEEMKRKSEAYHFDPDQALPPQVVNDLKEVLRFHDDVLRDIIKKMEMVPGLTDLIDGLSNALNACELTLPDPIAICSLKPLSKLYTLSSRRTSRYVFTDRFFDGRGTYGQRLAGPDPGHLRRRRGFIRCYFVC